jgi:hypothetical protein
MLEFPHEMNKLRYVLKYSPLACASLLLLLIQRTRESTVAQSPNKLSAF